jgi:hypothetical protein
MQQAEWWKQSSWLISRWFVRLQSVGDPRLGFGLDEQGGAGIPFQIQKNFAVREIGGV